MFCSFKKIFLKFFPKDPVKLQTNQNDFNAVNSFFSILERLKLNIVILTSFMLLRLTV